MANTIEELSPSYFRRYASLHPEIWNETVGNDIVHVTWGKCSIEKFDASKSQLYISGHKVHISEFMDKNFRDFRVSSDLAATILAYIKRRDELDEEEWAEQDRKRLLEKQSQTKAREEFIQAQLDAQRIELEKRQQEAIRREKIRREETEQRRRLERERQAELRTRRELESKKGKQKRAQDIQTFCSERGIHRLFHFTRVERISKMVDFGPISCWEWTDGSQRRTMGSG